MINLVRPFEQPKCERAIWLSAMSPRKTETSLQDDQEVLSLISIALTRLLRFWCSSNTKDNDDTILLPVSPLSPMKPEDWSSVLSLTSRLNYRSWLNVTEVELSGLSW
jgi:hypothetical protein